MPFFVNLEFHFVTVKVDGSCLETIVTQYLGESVQLEDFFLEITFPRFYDVLGFFVGEAAVALDDGVYDTRMLDFPFFRHFEDYGISQFFFVGTEGTDEIAQPFGQHRYGAVHKVNGGGPFLGFLVDDTAFFHVMGDVGNVYAYLPQIVFQSADGQGIVKVLCILGVDGEGGDVPEILASGNLFGGNFIGYLVGGLLYGGRIYIRQAEFGQNGVHLGGVVSGTSQDIDDLPDGVLRLVGPFHDLHDGFVARLSAFQFLFGDEDVIGKRTVLRYQKSV